MNHKHYLMTGIAIFIVLLIGGTGITYIFLTHQPAAARKTFAKVQQPSKYSQSLEKVPTPIDAKSATKNSSRHSPNQAKKVSMESGASLVHALNIAAIPPSKPEVASQDSETQKGKEEETLNLADLQFDLSRTGLKNKTKTTLDTYAKKLRDPQWSVLIQGHTDKTGSIRKNLYVGLRRANAVKDYLATKGIANNRLHAISLGEYEPVCIKNTLVCQSKNRRVSFAVARREGLIARNAVPITQEQVTYPEHSTVSNEVEQILASLPEIYEHTIDKPERVELIYPDPVHSTPPTSTPSGSNKF